MTRQHSRTFAVAALLATAGTAPAQWVWPAAFSGTAGNAVMNAPFTANPGHPTASTRCVVVLDASALPFPVGTVLNRLSLRRDTRYSTQGYGSSSGVLTVRMGRAAAPPSDLNDVRFFRLFDGAVTNVYANAPQNPFVLPAAGAPGSAVPGFNVVIPFTINHTWTGGPLAIEFLWTPSSGSSLWRVDAVALPRLNGVSRTVGAGCTGSNGFEPTHFALPETTSPGTTLKVQLEGARRPTAALELLALHVIGLQNQGPTLPMPLTVFGGVPGCYLRVDPVMSFAVPVSNPSLLFTRALSSISLPPQQSLAGAVIYSQWICFDTAFNTALPLTASDVQAITLGPVAPPPAPRSVRTFWKYGATGLGDEAGRMVPYDYGPVLKFN
jgi:hypothetical protein